MKVAILEYWVYSLGNIPPVPENVKNYTLIARPTHDAMTAALYCMGSVFGGRQTIKNSGISGLHRQDTNML